MRRLVGLLVGCALGGCHSERANAPDTEAPLLAVLSPAANRYDEDGDGLLDLRINWSDAGAIDPATARVRVLTPGAPPGTDTNALAHWNVSRRDSAGLLAHEVAAHLLPDGLNRLEIRVADTAGNATTDTIQFGLPHAVYVGHLADSAIPAGFPPGEQPTICADDGLLYLPVRYRVLVVDPESLRAVGTVPQNGGSTIDLWRSLCLPGSRLYITSSLVVAIDRQNLTWLPRFSGTFQSVAIASSRSDPDIIYLGESITATIGVFRISTQARTRLLSFAPNTSYIQDLAIMPGDTKLYAAYGPGGGIWVVDPAKDSVLKRISVESPGWSNNGTVINLALSNDDRRLYAAVLDGSPRGVVEIDTGTDSIIRRVALSGVPIDVELSPDNSRMFVTTSDLNGVQSVNYLLDVATLQVLTTFPRPRPVGTIRRDRGAVFRPDGKYIFVARDVGLDIYLNRPPAQ